MYGRSGCRTLAGGERDRVGLSCRLERAQRSSSESADNFAGTALRSFQPTCEIGIVTHVDRTGVP